MYTGEGGTGLGGEGIIYPQQRWVARGGGGRGWIGSRLVAVVA